MTMWQLFNTLRDGEVPFHFLAKAGRTTKLLQTRGGPDWPRVKQIEMTGEYPFAILRFRDADLPVELELTAFSPFAPLDTALSSLPLAAFVFRIHNPTGENQAVSLAGLMQNPVGYDAAGASKGNRHPSFGGNVNEVFRHAGSMGLVMRANAGEAPTLDRPVTICTAGGLVQGLNSPPADRPANLQVESMESALVPGKLKEPSQTIIWLEEAAADIPDTWLRAARPAVEAGATLVFAGAKMPLLQSYAQASGGKPVAPATGRPDILFEDFEHGYDKWKVEGDAFGKAPAHGTLPSQQQVSGFLGRGLVNTFLGGDDTTGRLVSQPFTVERNFIRFLVGGGTYGSTQIRLVVNGKVVRAASGRDQERLLPGSWDVHSFQGQMAHIEIVDEQKGPWGHVNVDQIEFSDRVGEQLALLDELLPARFSEVRAQRADPNVVEFAGLQLKPGAKRSALRNGLEVLRGSLGKGQVIIAAGPMLEAGAAEASGARQRAYALLCEIVGAAYTAPGGTSPKAPGFGTLALAALTEKVTVEPAFQDWKEAWDTFATIGGFSQPDQAKANPPTASGTTINGAVAASVTVGPGETVEVPCDVRARCCGSDAECGGQFSGTAGEDGEVSAHTL